MRLMMRKLAFAHRVLWGRDQTYRMASVLGPPVLLGALFAGALWLGLSVPGRGGAPWATPQPSGNLPQDGTPVLEKAAAPLPHPGPDGRIAGLEPGLDGRLLAVKTGPLGPDIPYAPPIAGFRPDSGTLDMSRIAAAGPTGKLFVGVQTGLLRVLTPGRYALTLRLQREAYEVANCVSRLSLNARHVLSQYNTGLVGQSHVLFDPVTFDLQPGLYRIAMAFGCWHDGEMSPHGRLTLMIRRPDEAAPGPAHADELFHPS